MTNDSTLWFSSNCGLSRQGHPTIAHRFNGRFRDNKFAKPQRGERKSAAGDYPSIFRRQYSVDIHPTGLAPVARGILPYLLISSSAKSRKPPRQAGWGDCERTAGGTSRVPSSEIPPLKRWAIVGRPSRDEDQTDTAA